MPATMERMSLAEFKANYPHDKISITADLVAPRASRFNAHRVKTEGRTYDSQQEYGDALWLKSLAERGRIKLVLEQFTVVLTDHFGREIWRWKCDFMVVLNDDRMKLVETKGYTKLRDWRILQKLTELFYPIELLVNPSEAELLA